VCHKPFLDIGGIGVWEIKEPGEQEIMGKHHEGQGKRRWGA
jgi:hypothetical protein